MSSKTDAYYFSDDAITDPDLDAFRRRPFARRVAQTIVNHKDISSIVIGIYGAWGEGKTSLLSLIEGELKNDPNVVCIHFNPWRFTDETALLRQFFSALANALDKNATSPWERIGGVLEDY